MADHVLCVPMPHIALWNNASAEVHIGFGMNTKKLSADLSVGQQLQLDDIPTLAELGFRSIICNRPDGEQANQPTFEQVSETARELKLETRYLPVVPGNFGSKEGDSFDSALQNLPKPVFAYCRTGFRSEKLWALTQPGGDNISTLQSVLKTIISGLSRAFKKCI